MSKPRRKKEKKIKERGKGDLRLRDEWPRTTVKLSEEIERTNKLREEERERKLSVIERIERERTKGGERRS